jgi:Family of unknown function (DUF6173)
MSEESSSGSIFDSPLKKLFQPSEALSALTKVRLEPIRMPEIDFAAMHRAKRETEMADAGYAHVIFDRLRDSIAEFEQGLRPDEEVAAKLASFGSTVVIRITDIGYYNPFLLTFDGFTMDDPPQRIQLVQHTTQLNCLLMAVKASEPEKPRRKIGFHSDDEAAT